ncbi:hypothetical protein RAAC3_TM7C00001G0229 [Candidatus Saccharibacteria bacterium RAAC3_TM7_1]|nr:hypothetical protein RAAC3_TM7C00001G0229 [Candidatus Saccharibacteria bacterium RAAC3_TM7_1]
MKKAAPIDVVKRDGKRPSEHFNPDKLHTSIMAACLSVRSPQGEASLTAQTVCDAVEHWCGQKSEITSADIRRIASTHLERIHPEAAYLYKHHRLVL